MKAIVVRQFGGPEVMKYEHVRDPEPSRGEVLVRIHASGVNPVDTYVRAGTYTRKPPLPWTPGTDAAGVVEKVGDGVSGFAPGDRVYTLGTHTGTYAELALASDNQLVKLPPKVSFAQGAALYVPYTTAWV